MTIKPFLNKMSADLASALGGGKTVSNSSSLESKTGDTGDVSFKNVLNQALEPKSKKVETPKTASTFASAPASSLKTKNAETGKASTKAQDSSNEPVQSDEPSADLLTATMAAQTVPVQPETPEPGLNLLSLAEAQALTLAEAQASHSENAAPAKDAEPNGKAINLTMAQADLTPVLPRHFGEIAQTLHSSQNEEQPIHFSHDTEQSVQHRDKQVQNSENADASVQLPAQAQNATDVITPSLVALMAATPSFPAMPPATITPTEEAPTKRSASDKVISQTKSPQKGLKLELVQASFLIPQPQATLPQSFAKAFQGLNSAHQQEDQALGSDAPQATIDTPKLSQTIETKSQNALEQQDYTLTNEFAQALEAKGQSSDEYALSQADTFNAALNPLNPGEAALLFMPATEAAPASDLSALNSTDSTHQPAATSSEQFAQIASNNPEIDATAVNSLQMQGQFLNATAPGPEKSIASKGSEPVDPKKVDTVSTKQMTELPSVSSQQVTTSKNKSSNMETLGKKTKPIEESETQETSNSPTQKSGFEHLLSQAGMFVEMTAASGADNTTSTDSTLPVFVSQEAAPGDQVMEATAYAAKNGHRELIIKLNPDNLGAVKINLISHAEGGLSAKLIASSPESAALLSQQAESLQASLEAKGVKVEKISVIVAGQGEFSAVTAGSEANKSQFQQSSHDHNPNPEQKQQSHTSQQQNFNQEQQHQQMAQAFQQQMNQSHRQSYSTQSQSSNTGTTTTAQASGTEAASSIEANPPVKTQTPGAISVLA